MADEIRNIEIHFDTNASQVNQEVDGLNQAVAQSTTNTTSNTVATHSNTQALAQNSKSVLDNGGAMGILNMLTGGYAQIVKDAVEASSLFTKAKKADAVATEIQTVATGKASIATTIWNAILALNPVVLITAGVVALTAGLYFLTKAFIDNAEAVREVNSAIDLAILKNESYKNSVKQLNSDLDSLNAVEIARAKAMGASSEEIDKMTVKQKALNKELLGSQAKDAYKNLLEGQQLLRNARIVDDEDAIKNAEENLKARKSIYEEANQAYNKSIDDETIAIYAIQEKALEQEKALIQKSIDNRLTLNKERLSSEKKLIQDIQNLQDKSEESKLARQKQRDLDEIKALEQKGIDTRKLLVLNTEKYNILEDELKVKRAKEIIEDDKLRDEELKNADKKRNQEKNDSDAEQGKLKLAGYEANYEEKKAIDKLEAEKEAKFQQDKDNVILASKQNLTDSIASLETIGLTKTKAGQAIAKTLALTQIGIDSAVALSKASTLANAEGVAAQLAFPTVPGVGTIARVASYASTALSVGANIIKAKALLSSGGGGSVSGGSAGASPSVNAGSQPSVSFVASNENQIANSINSNEQNKEPIKAYVVSKEISTAQELDRNLIESTTI